MYMTSARTEQFETVELLGVPGLFSTLRVNRTTIPKGLYAYDMQTNVDDWLQPCLLARYIAAEHFGTVLTASPIPLPESGYLELVPGDFAQNSIAERLTVAEFEARYLPPAPPRHRRPAVAHGAPGR